LNVFVLSCGRSASLTFVKACEHIENYTVGHETRMGFLGKRRLDYPLNHIEANNRLSWLLGSLDELYGDSALYVHLRRNREDVVNSFLKRLDRKTGIIWAYASGILSPTGHIEARPVDICGDFYDIVNSNIGHFLKDKSSKMVFRVENAKEDFKKFWGFIGARGNLGDALKEWDRRYNESK